MKNGRLQAKDIPDQVVIDAVVSQYGVHGGNGPNNGLASSSLWDVQRVLSDYPPKVVLAKLASLIERGMLDGCACGCRGDFAVIASNP
jgi:hypothetical protein